MKLSEAILLGSIGSEQGFGHMSGNPANKTKCAIGAALFAIGVEGNSCMNPFSELQKAWPWVYNWIPRPPVLGPDRIRTYVAEVIYLLNDNQRWTRPRIAAWVAEQEAIYDLQAVVQEVPTLVA